MMLKVTRYIKKLKNKNIDKKNTKKDSLVKSKSTVDKTRKKKKLLLVKRPAARAVSSAEPADESGKTMSNEAGLSEAMHRVTIATRTRARQVKSSPTLEKSKKLLRDAVKKSKQLGSKVSAKLVPRTRFLRSAVAVTVVGSLKETCEGVSSEESAGVAVAPADEEAGHEAATSSAETAASVEDSSAAADSTEVPAVARRIPTRSRAAKETGTSQSEQLSEQVSLRPPFWY